MLLALGVLDCLVAVICGAGARQIQSMQDEVAAAPDLMKLRLSLAEIQASPAVGHTAAAVIALPVRGVTMPRRPADRSSAREWSTCGPRAPDDGVPATRRLEVARCAQKSLKASGSCDKTSAGSCPSRPAGSQPCGKRVRYRAGVPNQTVKCAVNPYKGDSAPEESRAVCRRRKGR